MLYIPKKGDILQIRLNKNDNKVIFQVNKKDISSIDYVDFAGHLADFYTPLVSSRNRNWHEEIIQKPITISVDNNYYFLVGDNRDNSHDSRTWGFVPENLIVGKPSSIYWPIKRMGFDIE